MNSSSRDHEQTSDIALEWWSIETAPTGTLVFGCDAARGYRAVVFRNDQGEWECADFAGNPMGVGFYPTHWMPLPPSSAKQVPGDSSRDDVKPYEAEVGERQP